MRDQPFYNPLQVCYFSQTPYKLGAAAIKFSVRPISRATNGKPEKTEPHFLREAMTKQLGEEDVYFDFLVQAQRDAARMPVEDSLVVWDEKLSPFVRVATARVPKQEVGTKARLELAEKLAFAPWHSPPEHRPLGSINRARRVVYEVVSDFRRETNGAPRTEPTKLPR